MKAKCKNCNKEIEVDDESEEIFCSAECLREFNARSYSGGLSW